jgi:RNA polymerase sigma factor (sigma-70 family)
MTHIGFGRMQTTQMESATSRGIQPVADFEELAMPLLNSAYNLARWLARNDHDAEDLVQETFLKALRNFQSFQSGTNFRAWVYRILHNTFLNSRSGLRAASTVSLDSEEEGPELATENETPETILLRSSSSQLVQSAIDDLPVHFRETLLLCDVEEMSYRETADILSIPMGTVMSRLARARKLVRESLRNTRGTPRSTDWTHRTEAHETVSSSYTALSSAPFSIS